MPEPRCIWSIGSISISCNSVSSQEEFPRFFSGILLHVRSRGSPCPALQTSTRTAASMVVTRSPPRAFTPFAILEGGGVECAVSWSGPFSEFLSHCSSCPFEKKLIFTIKDSQKLSK